MTRRGIRIVRVINKAADFCVFFGSFILGYLTRFYLDLYNSPIALKFDLHDLQLLFILYMTTNLIVMSSSRIYPAKRLRSFSEVAWIYFKNVALSLILLISAVYVIFFIKTSRLLLLSASCYAFFFLLVKEWLVRRALLRFRKKGKNLRNVIIVGGRDQAIEKMAEEVERNHLLGLQIKGVITLSKPGLSAIAGIPVIGPLADLEAALDREVVDCVIFLTGYEQNEQVKDAIIQCDQRGLEIWVQFDFFKKTISAVDIERLEGMPFLNFHSGPENAAAIVFKYAADRIASLILLILLSPVFLFVTLGIKLTSPGPVIFKQHRVGLNGRRFVFLKFRSMVNNAEQLRHALHKKNEMKGPVFKMKDDPRITPFGKFLRKTSLDELPQLWNVFIGDMSLVGPRPPIPSEVQHYTGWQRRRLSMRPGITCIWQVEGRNKIQDFSDWARLDLEYIDNWSLWLDLKLLLKTIPAVLKATGL